MLHVAPENCYVKRFKSMLGNGYITADLDSPDVTLVMDITDIPFKDKVFDVIYCSHVLEHVLNDRQAMREFYRVLKPGGWAILLVPITTELTLEDSSVTEPNDRLRLYGQQDHVRRYGSDYLDRLKESGFYVNVVKPMDFLSTYEMTLMGITTASGDIYYCKRIN